MTDALKAVTGAQAVAAEAPPLGAGPGAYELSCKVNGRDVSARVHPFTTLLDALRFELGLTGTKGACLEGECGSCTVFLDGTPVCSCLVMAPQANGHEITTIEGLAHGAELSLLQRKFVECGAVQCGYCTPGLVLAAKYLLENTPNLTEEQFVKGMEGNICRCTGYTKIFDAIKAAWTELQASR